jgi:hypothetical protein
MTPVPPTPAPSVIEGVPGAHAILNAAALSIEIDLEPAPSVKHKYLSLATVVSDIVILVAEVAFPVNAPAKDLQLIVPAVASPIVSVEVPGLYNNWLAVALPINALAVPLVPAAKAALVNIIFLSLFVVEEVIVTDVALPLNVVAVTLAQESVPPVFTKASEFGSYVNADARAYSVVAADPPVVLVNRIRYEAAVEVFVMVIDDPDPLAP